MKTQEQVKISAAQAAQVYAEVPGVLLKLASERDVLTEKLAEAEAELSQYRLNARMSKIATKMADKSIGHGKSVEEHLSTIKEAHASGRSLDAIEEAIEMTAPDGSFGKIAEDANSSNGAGDPLTGYLLGDLTP